MKTILLICLTVHFFIGAATGSENEKIAYVDMEAVRAGYWKTKEHEGHLSDLTDAMFKGTTHLRSQLNDLLQAQEKLKLNLQDAIKAERDDDTKYISGKLAKVDSQISAVIREKSIIEALYKVRVNSLRPKFEDRIQEEINAVIENFCVENKIDIVIPVVYLSKGMKSKVDITDKILLDLNRYAPSDR